MADLEDEEAAQRAPGERPAETAVQSEAKHELAALIESLDGVDSVAVVQLEQASSPPVVVIEADANPAALAPQITALLGKHHLSAQPVVVGRHQWRVLEELLPAKGWIDVLHREQARCHQLARLQTPRQVRRFLLAAIRSHRGVLDFAQRSEQLPLWLTLELCATAVEDTLSLLFATKRQPYGADEATVERFEQLFVATGDFELGDLQVALELRGLAHQARLLFGLAPDVRLEWLGALKRAHRLLDRFKAYVASVFVSEAERRRRRLMSYVGASIAGVLAIVGVVSAVVATRPIEPIRNTARIKAPGGIVGTYFNGRRFQTKIVSRTDHRISFSTNGAPAPGLKRDNFSARWEGFLFFPRAGKQLLCIECDDGGRLFFNNKELIDDWKIQSTNRSCATVRVKQGWYPLKVEYFEVSRVAVMRLLRGESKRRLLPIPPAHLCCRDERDKAKQDSAKDKAKAPSSARALKGGATAIITGKAPAKTKVTPKTKAGEAPPTPIVHTRTPRPPSVKLHKPTIKPPAKKAPAKKAPTKKAPAKK